MLKKVFHTFVTSIAIAGMTFLTTSLLSKYFGAEGVGEIGVFLFVCSLIAVLSAVFGSSTIVYVLPKHKFNVVFIVCLVWAILSALLFCCFAVLFGYHVKSYSLLIFVSATQSIFINNLSFLLALNKVKLYNFFRLIQPISLIVLFSVLYISEKNVSIVYYLVLFAVSYILPIVITTFYLLPSLQTKISYHWDDFKKVLIDFFSFGSVGQLTNLVQQLNYKISYFVLVYFCGKSDVGVMVLALTFVDGIWIFKNSMGLLKYVQTSVNEKIEYTNIKLIKISFLATLGLLLFALIIPNEVYYFFFGKDFSSLKSLLLLMSPGILCMTATSIYANYFAGTGKVKYNLTSAAIGFVVFVPSIYFLTKAWGLTGGAIANNIPLIIGTLVTFYLKRNLKETK